MNNEDLLKKLESLEKRLSELESQKKLNLSMFGRSYTLVGNSDSDFLIKTKGQVKILWGSKFIDLIKDGKINVDSDFIFTVKSADKIGNKDGIYVVNDSVYLKVGNNPPINLLGEIGNTYISFMEGQVTTSDAKYNAMVNIGFIHKSLLDIDGNSLQNGVIYVESELKLYIVKDGTLTEFRISISNPFTELFVILKSDSSKGALVIKGTGAENSIAFDSFWFYSEYDNCIIDASNSVIFRSGGSDKITIGWSSVKVNTDLVTNMLKSEGATSDNGFRLYYIDGESVLEVDRIILRGNESGTILYPEYWLLNNAVIKEASSHNNSPENDDEGEGENEPTNILDITLFQESTYKVGDILCTYKLEDIEEPTGEYDEEGEEITNTRSSYTRVELEVIGVEDYGKVLQVKCSSLLDESTINNFIGRFIFLIKSSSNKSPIRLKSNNIDIVEYGELSEDKRIESVRTRIGDLSELKDGETLLEDYGIYTDHLVLGGTLEKDFPKYTETTNNLVSNIDINESNLYNCVLVSIGLLKLVLKEYLETIVELKQKVETMEADILEIKEQLNQISTS